MKNCLFACSDSSFLVQIGLPTDLCEALLLVYQSSSGVVGFDSDANGKAFLRKMLTGSITIDELGGVTPFEPTASIEMYFTRLLGNRGLTIHGPDAAIYAEALALAEYEKRAALNLTYARFGKEKPLPPAPILRGLFKNQSGFGQTIQWMLSHSSGICVWNRFTEYGMQPTAVAGLDSEFLSILKRDSPELMIECVMVSSERSLPCW